MNIFRKIEDFEDYEVDNDGNVKSLKRNIIMKTKLIPRGYEQVQLCKNGKHYPKYVHRLVAEAFLPNPNNLPQINHKDEIKTNNHVELELDDNGNIIVNEEKSNLEWCDGKYNCNYGTHNAKIAAKRRIIGSPWLKGKKRDDLIDYNKKTKSKSVILVKDGEIMEFQSLHDAAKKIGSYATSIYRACRKLNRVKQCKGYDCYYKEDYLNIKKEDAI